MNRRRVLWLAVIGLGFGVVLARAVVAQDTQQAPTTQPQTTFTDDQTHDVTYPAAADGKGTFNASGSATVNLLPGSEGALVARGDAVINVRGGALGLIKAGPSNRLSGQAAVHFFSGALQRRFISMTDKSSLTFHAGGDFKELQQIELRKGTPTLTFYLHPEAASRDDVKIVVDSFAGAFWTEFDEHYDKSGKLCLAKGTRREDWRVATRIKITLRLPGDAEPRTIQVSAYAGNPIRNDEDGADSTSNLPRPLFGLNQQFLNFDGTVKEGHINFIPAGAAPASQPAPAAAVEDQPK